MFRRMSRSNRIFTIVSLFCAAAVIAICSLILSGEPPARADEPSSLPEPASSISASIPQSSVPVQSSKMPSSAPSGTAPSSRPVSSSEAESDEGEPVGIYKSLRKMQEKNSDTVGWLIIDGTKCDYAVMQSDDNDYYLTHNVKKNKSKKGALFADYRCRFAGGLSKNTVIYGHSMKDGSMFTQLFAYKKLSTLQKQPIVRFAVDNGSEDRWKIFACMITDTSFNYITPDPDDSDFMDMIAEMRRRSLFETDVEVSENDKILTLSTCTYEYDSDDVRFVIAARRMHDGESEDISASKNKNIKKPEL